MGTADLTDSQFSIFYDALWELARIGVLRPGRVAPRNQETANDFGDHWTITKVGFEWLATASQRPFLDMSRMSEVLTGFTPRFGPGYGQRAMEAVRTYRTTNYLSSCTMAGAAAGSILLAAAIAKNGNEGKILKMYEAAGWPRPRYQVSYWTGNKCCTATVRGGAADSQLLAR